MRKLRKNYLVALQSIKITLKPKSKRLYKVCCMSKKKKNEKKKEFFELIKNIYLHIFLKF